MSSDVPSGVSELGRSPKTVRSKFVSFVAGFFVAAVAACGVCLHFYNRLQAKHADCPLDSTEVFLRSMAALSPAERASLEAMLKSNMSQGLYPVVTSRLGSYKTAVQIYERRMDVTWCREFTAEKIREMREALDQAMSDKELSFRLGPQLEQTKSEIENVLGRLPEIRELLIRKENGEPGATDNPDDAQRLREDH